MVFLNKSRQSSSNRAREMVSRKSTPSLSASSSTCSQRDGVKQTLLAVVGRCPTSRDRPSRTSRSTACAWRSRTRAAAAASRVGRQRCRACSCARRPARGGSSHSLRRAACGRPLLARPKVPCKSAPSCVGQSLRRRGACAEQRGARWRGCSLETLVGRADNPSPGPCASRVAPVSPLALAHLECISGALRAHVSPAVALTSKTPSSMESIVTSKVPARPHLEPSRVSVSGHLEESRGEASAPHLGAARASAQVVHQDILLALSPSGLVEAVCDRGGGRLVDDAEHLKSRPPVPGPPGSSRVLSVVISDAISTSSRRHLGVISVPSHHARHYRGIISALQIPRATLRPAIVPASLVAW